MQGTAHAANKKEEYPPAPTRVPKPAEKGQQVPVILPTPQQKLDREISEKLTAAATSIAGDASRERLAEKVKLLKQPLPDEYSMRTDYFYTVLFPVCADKDFLEFRKGGMTFPLPQEGTREFKAVLDLNELDPPSKYFEIRVDWDKKTVTISNIYLKDREMWLPFLPAIEKVLARGDDSAVAALDSTIEAIRGVQTEIRNYSQVWKALRFESSETAKELLSLVEDLYALESKFISVYSKRITYILDFGTAPPSLSPEEEKLLGKIGSLKEQIEIGRVAFSFEKMSGKDAIKRIEKGIKAGLYSSPETAFFEQAKKELEEAIKGLSPISKGERRDTLSSNLKLELELVETIVDTLEVMAWKQDAAELESSLSSGGTRPIGMVGLHGASQLSIKQFESGARARASAIAERGAAYCDMVLSNLLNIKFADEEKASFTEEDRVHFTSAFNAEKEKLKGLSLAGPLGKSAESIARIGGEAELKLSERYEEAQIKNPRNAWHLRAFSYAKLRVLRNAPEIIGAGIVVGGAVGLATPASSGGMLAGAATGGKIAGLFVGSVATFAGVEAFYRYATAASGSIAEERAIADMRSSVVYMGFAIGGVGGAVGKALSIGAGGAMMGSSAVSAYERIKAGEYFEVATDLIYVAMGSVAFFRIGGGFRAVALEKDLGNTVVYANSAGITRAAIGSDFAKFMLKPLEVGYSMPWFAANVAFATTAAYPQLATALDNHDPKAFMNSLGRSFETVTSAMVTFEVALAGAGALAGGASRVYRFAMRGREANLAEYAAEQGLLERVSEISVSGGKKLGEAESGQLLELVFLNRGNVSKEYVQAALKLEGKEGVKIAEKIADEINLGWKDARIALSKSPKTQKFVLGQMDKFRKVRESRAFAAAGKVGQALVLGGGILIIEGKSLRDRMLNRDFSKLLRPQEIDFINVLLSPAINGLEINRSLNYPMLRDALATVQGISEKIEEGKHPLSKNLSLSKASEETRERFLYSCAIALLMNGRDASEKEISALADQLDEALSVSEIRISPPTRIDALTLLASGILLKGEGSALEFSEYYNGCKEDFPKVAQPVLLDYAASSFFMVALGNKDETQARDAMRAVLQKKMNPYFPHDDASGQVYSLWSLVLAFDMLGGGLGSKEVSEAVSTAERTVNSVISGSK